jgi:hypothetical protein
LGRGMGAGGVCGVGIVTGLGVGRAVGSGVGVRAQVRWWRVVLRLVVWSGMGVP